MMLVMTSSAQVRAIGDKNYPGRKSRGARKIREPPSDAANSSFIKAP